MMSVSIRQRVTEWTGILDMTMGALNLVSIIILASLYPHSQTSLWCDRMVIVSLISQFMSSFTFILDLFKPLEKSRYFAWQLMFYTVFTGVTSLVSILYTFVESQLHSEPCGGGGQTILFIGVAFHIANAATLLVGSVLVRQYQLQRHVPLVAADAGAVAIDVPVVDVDLGAAIDASLREVSRVASTPTTINVDDFQGLREVTRHSSADEKQCNVVSCTICLYDLWSSDEQVRAVEACGHQFHAKCIMPWILRGKNTCPNCRGPIIYRRITTTSLNTILVSQ